MWKKVRQFLTGGDNFKMPETSEQSTNFAPVTDVEALDDLLARSHAAPVIIFKHSTTCPISARAHGQMSQVATGAGGQISLVIVQRAQELSRRVAEQTGLQHESPQVIVLRNGGVVWSASHFDITTEAVEKAVRENA